jgi:hypothetical protein
MGNWSFSEGIAVLMAIVAIFAAVVGPVVTYTVTMRQLQVQLTVAKAQVISPMRQAWINKLRERIAVFSALTSLIIVFKNSGTEHRKDVREMYELSQEILLLLHVGEPEHDLIALKVTELLKCTTSDNKADIGQIQRELRKITQKVLHDEWGITKKMELDAPGL